MHRKTLLLAVLCAIGRMATAADADLGTIVVTAPEMADPLTVETDPKAPVQPVPAADGAAYLKNIPGFSLIRKGGTSADPVFRGQAGSRLNIVADDAHIFGGCGMRMDPPTAYTYPESFDRITVLKGPQSVRHGVSPAGTVLFERDTERFAEPTVRTEASLLGGSFGRHDEVVDAVAGNATGSLRGAFTRSESDDYEDGDGTEVHSRYERWSGTVAGTWNATESTQIEISADRSDAEAAYADRAMDGTKFDRTGYGLKVVSRDLSSLVEKLEVSAFYNYVDHVMDNFSLRTLTGTAQYNNPDRLTTGARIAAQLNLGERTFAWVGVDQQEDEHTLRTATGAAALSGPSGTRNPDASFHHLGLFGEIEHDFNDSDRVVVGLRQDLETARAEKKVGMPATYGGAVAGTEDEDTNNSGFSRIEHRLANLPATLYAGYGIAVRSPDYWERAKEFTLKQERTGQFDVGMSYRADRLRWTLSAFHARHDDYILVTRTGPMTYTASNIDASTWGGEADMSYQLSDAWRLTGTLAYVRGENETADRPLAQVPPAQATLGLAYAGQVWSAGLVARVADEQDRVDVGNGNIAGQDIGPTSGFTVWSINAGYKVRDNVALTMGVDNLFDVTYAEHISRAGAVIPGFEQTTRVNEPGRNYWLKARVQF